MRKFTNAEIEAVRSSKGGWTRKGVAKLGVPWPLVKGWRAAITKKTVAEKLAEENDRYIGEAQRGKPLPIDYGQIVLQVFVCQDCRQKLTRTETLRTLVHVNSDPPTHCRECSPE